ncbi:MAG: sugar transferase [Chloroflexi bacterium]|nr:sugar transferase [Chloroflexota bacterium]
MSKTAFNQPRWLLPVVDAGLVVVAFLFSYYLRYEVQFLQPVDEANDAPFTPYVPYAAMFVGLMWLFNQNASLYRERRGRTWWEEMFAIGNSATNTAVFVMALSFLLQPLVFSRLLIIQSALLTVVLLGLWRIVLRQVQNQMRKRGVGVERVLVVGAGSVGLAVMQTIIARPDLGYKLIGFVDDNPERGSTDLGRVPAYGQVDNLPGVIERERIDTVVITLPWQVQRKIVQIVRECESKHVRVRTVPDMFELSLSQVQVEMLGGIPLLGLNGEAQLQPSSRLIKRAIDIALTLLALPVVGPLIGLVALAIKLDTPGPIFFSQERVGLNGKRFKVYKFRSMIQDAEKYHDKLIRDTGEDPRHPKIANDPRITRVGRLIRRFSIDELPQSGTFWAAR